MEKKMKLAKLVNPRVKPYILGISLKNRKLFDHVPFAPQKRSV